MAAALSRLAADADAEVRTRAAQAMGELADPVYLPALVALLSDPQVRVVALVSLPQVAGQDVTAGQPAQSDEQRAEAWRAWYETRQ